MKTVLVKLLAAPAVLCAALVVVSVNAQAFAVENAVFFPDGESCLRADCARNRVTNACAYPVVYDACRRSVSGECLLAFPRSIGGGETQAVLCARGIPPEVVERSPPFTPVGAPIFAASAVAAEDGSRLGELPAVSQADDMIFIDDTLADDDGNTLTPDYSEGDAFLEEIRAENRAMEVSIIAAVRGDSVEEYRRLADDGAWLSFPLHLAARANAMDMVKYLIEKGADVNDAGCVVYMDEEYGNTQCDRNDTTPLHEAARSNALEIASLLVSVGATINALDETGLTPLHFAAMGDAADVAEFLISLGVKADVVMDDVSEYLPAYEDGHMTPLHIAAQNDSAKVAKLLIESGANVNAHKPLLAEAISDMSVLDYAAEANALAVAKLLLESGADVNNENAVDYDNYEGEGNHPLHWAALSGSAEMVKLLLDRGAEIDARNGVDQTPFHWAIMRDAPDVMKLFIERGADAEAKSGGEFTLVAHSGAAGQTPLHIAASYNSERAAALLIELGADVNNAGVENYEDGGKGITPLHLAARDNGDDAAKVLIESGANVNAKTEFGQTPLDQAIEENHAEMQSLLREHGGVCAERC